MAYADIYNAAVDVNFQGRCWVACWKAAQDILGESDQTPDYERRAIWAQRVMEGKTNLTGTQLAMQVLANATIASNPGASPDADIQFQVSSVIATLVRIG